MEVLNEDDLDWLTRVENRLMTMRKREAAHRPHSGPQRGLDAELHDSIKGIHNLRVFLQIRFGKNTEELM
jgi:hypothetical protein